MKWFDKLLMLKEKAYAPYSNFKVAAICVLKNGKEFYGVNVENASYPVTVCAERIAIGQIFAYGYASQDIDKIYLYTDSMQIGTPCGLCRQFMVEVIAHDADLIIYNKNEQSLKLRIDELLPYSFTNKDLI